MRQVFGVIAGLGLILELGAARAAAADPAAVLAANHAASGGAAWTGKAVMKTDAKLAGQGLTGTATSLVDLRTGHSVSRFTLGPGSGAEGFDGRDVWEQGLNGEVNLEKGGDALPMAPRCRCRRRVRSRRRPTRATSAARS